MTQRHRVLQVGLGPIGIEMARRAARRQNLAVVGAVDIDPKLEGKAL